MAAARVILGTTIINNPEADLIYVLEAFFVPVGWKELEVMGIQFWCIDCNTRGNKALSELNETIEL